MATSITITITATRALTVEGRLVAGETAEVTIGGVTPTALYLVAPDQTVVAACEAFTPMGQGSGGTGFLQLATGQVAALFAHTPAGRMVAVWALVNDADGVAGAGWIPVVSAPMPDELVDLDIDFYLRASQVGAGLAIVDGKLVCTVNPATPIAPSTDPSAAGKPADAKATGDQLAAKLSRAEAEAGYTEWSVTPPTLDGATLGIRYDADYLLYALIDVATGGSIDTTSPGSYPADNATSLSFQIDVEYVASRAKLQPTVPVQSVNGKTGVVVLGASDVGAAPAAAVHYAIGVARTVSGQLADRACNRVIALADNVADIVLTFPDVPQEGGVSLLAARDFLVLVTNTTGNTGSITFTPPTGAVVYGDGFTNSPASGETWLYSVTEVALNTFWVKSVKMEVAQ